MDSRRNRIAHLSGRRIVEMVKENLTIDKILTRTAFLNAIATNAAVGGSTNAVVHLLAIAGRLGVDLKLEVGTCVLFLRRLYNLKYYFEHLAALL